MSGLRESLTIEAPALALGSPLAPDGAADVPHAAASTRANASVKMLRVRGDGAWVEAGCGTPLSYPHAATHQGTSTYAHRRRAQ